MRLSPTVFPMVLIHSKMTIEQFTEWVAETFPDNSARLIAESNFRDALTTLAEFVVSTNSSEVIQESLAQITAIKDAAQVSATAAQVSSLGAEEERTLTAALRQQAINETAAYMAQFQSLIAQGYKPKGNYTLATNSPDLSTVAKSDGDAYIILDDGNTSLPGSVTPVKRGDALQWNATDAKWVYRPNAAIPGDGTVSAAKFVDWIKNLNQQLPDDSLYLYLLSDALNRKLFAIRKADGFIEGRFVIEAINLMVNSVHSAAIQAGAVDTNKLAQAVKDVLYQQFDNTESLWARLFTDSIGRIISGEKKDGTTWISKPEFPSKSLKRDWLAQEIQDLLPTTAFNRLNAYNPNVVETEDDGLMRGVEIDVPCTTDFSGYGFTSFPPVATKSLLVINSLAFAIQIRRTRGASIRGRRNRGTFNPAASGIQGTTLKGNYGNSYTNSYPAFPAGNTGDCWICDTGPGTTVVNGVPTVPPASVTANGLTFKSGDLLVKTATGYDIQPGPGDGIFADGDFWDITGAATFAGMSFSVTGRIIALGYMSQSGPKYIRFAAAKKGEYFLNGECAAGFSLPATPRDGDMYNFSAAATISGLTGNEGDSLIYNGGWGVLRGEMQQVEPGTIAIFNGQNAQEFAMRRADKSPGRATITAKAYWSTVSKDTDDSIILRSDSMFGGMTGTGGKILTATGRNGFVTSFGGGTSNDVLAMIRFDIRNGDPYAGWVNVFWHGQNNLTDEAQIKNAAFEMAALVGAKNKRFVFWSVLGQRAATYSGGRIVVAFQEDAKAGTNGIARIEQFYAAAFPKQWFSPRKALLETAVGRTAPDPQFPGMTEEQVAATYGIVPFSYFFDFTGKPFTQAELTQAKFLGYHSAAGLPTGGTDKDYYVRTGNGAVGQLIVNVAGAWTEYAHDVTHLNTAGQDAAAGKFKDFLTSIKI